MIESITDFFYYDFLLYALITIVMISIIAGTISPLIVAKKYSFIGESISHSTLLTISLAVSILQALQTQFPVLAELKGIYFFLTLFLTYFLIYFLAKATYRQNLPEDSLIGIYLTTTLALGVIVHQKFTDGHLNLTDILFGNILYLETIDFYIIFPILFIILLLFIMYLKNWIIYVYDEQGAYFSGLNLKFYHYGLLYILGTLIICSVKLSGTLLINTLLILPGALSYKVGKSIKSVFVIAISYSLIGSILGLYTANLFDLPPGACIAFVLFCLFVGSIVFEKIRDRVNIND